MGTLVAVEEPQSTNMFPNCHPVKVAKVESVTKESSSSDTAVPEKRKSINAPREEPNWVTAPDWTLRTSKTSFGSRSIAVTAKPIRRTIELAKKRSFQRRLFAYGLIAVSRPTLTFVSRRR
ncbi:MAG: hypothetical protein HKUEN07_07050 [Rhodocyclaceae bacterium]|nr:MAG: hypothetical protein HKUEN07_07050 [Rhodocyclaceae bacterium]